MTPDWFREYDRAMDEHMRVKAVVHTLGSPLDARRAIEARSVAHVTYEDWHRVLIERDELRARLEGWRERFYFLLCAATFTIIALACWIGERS